MPRAGRPTDNFKGIRLQFRLSDSDLIKLQYCCKKIRISKAEVLRQGINIMYEKAIKEEK